MKKVLRIIILSFLCTLSVQAEDSLKFFKIEILGAEAKKMEKSLRAIKKTKKVLSIVEEDGDKAIEIKITKKNERT